MKPGAQRIAHPKRSCLADQHEERRLKGIFGFVLIADDGQADAPNHGFVPLDQCREGELGHLVAVGRETFQKLAVGQVANRPNIVEGSELT